MPFGEDRAFSPEETQRLRDLIAPNADRVREIRDRGNREQLGDLVKRIDAAFKLAGPEPEPPGDRSELLATLEKNPEARAIRDAMRRRVLT